MHPLGGALAVLLAALATVVTFLKLRRRKDLWIGSDVLTVRTAVGTYFGGLVRDNHQDTLTAVHIPPGTLMALVVWLPLRASWYR